jgi:hypothetical protein
VPGPWRKFTLLTASAGAAVAVAAGSAKTSTKTSAEDAAIFPNLIASLPRCKNRISRADFNANRAAMFKSIRGN